MAIIKPTLNLVASEYTPEIINMTRASGATRVNAVGLVERVSAGTLRYDYDPTTLAGKGWLIEEARTNILIQSEDLQTNWTAQNVGFGTKGTAPDGKTTAELVDDSGGTTSNHSVYYSYSFTSGTSYTLSAWFKVGSGSHGWLQMPSSAFPGNISAEFDITNLTSVDISDSGASAESITMVEYPNGWVRCSITDTADATTSGNVQMGLNDGNGTTTVFTGSGLNMYMWGIQLEAGAFPTSYIPTTTAAVTRSEDSVSVPLSDFDFNFNEQTIYLQSTATAFNGMAALAVYLNGSNTVSFFVNPTTTLRTHRQTSGLQGNLDFTKAAGIEFRAALSIAQDDVAFSVDGETPELDTGHNMNSTLTTVWLGSNGATSPYSGYISHVAIFNKAMSDADIQTITTG